MDFDLANTILDFDETSEGYVRHHVDNYDVNTNTFTLELVEKDAYNTSKPHSGECTQYDAVYGQVTTLQEEENNRI